MMILNEYGLLYFEVSHEIWIGIGCYFGYVSVNFVVRVLALEKSSTLAA